MKYPKYPKYKDSGIEWIGEIPEHWKVTPLKFVSNVIMGQSPPSDHYTETGEIPFLQGCAEFGAVSPDPKHYCEVATKISQPGDILLSVRAPVGEINLSDKAYGIGRGLCAIRSNSAEQGYIKWWLEAAKGELMTISTGSTYDAVAIDDVKNLKMSISCSLDEQKIMLDFLNLEISKVDFLISKQQQLIEILKDKRQAIITHAVTKGLDPNVPMKDSGIEWIGKIPEQWKLIRTKNLLRERDERSRTGEEELFSLSKENGLISRSRITENVARADTLVGYKRFYPGDIVMNKMQAWNGVFGHSTSSSGIVSPEYTVLYQKGEVNTDYFAHVFRTDLYASIFALYARGMGTAFLRLNFNELGGIYLPVPSKQEQDYISSFINRQTDKINELILKQEKMIELLKEHKTSLINQAVTGKIDVRGLAQEVK